MEGKRESESPNSWLFTDAQFSDMTKWKVDNLVTHICALALIVDNFETDVNDIREDLSLDNRQ